MNLWLLQLMTNNQLLPGMLLLLLTSGVLLLLCWLGGQGTCWIQLLPEQQLLLLCWPGGRAHAAAVPMLARGAQECC